MRAVIILGLARILQSGSQCHTFQCVGGKVLEVVGLFVEFVFNFFGISLLQDFGYLVTGFVRQWGTPPLFWDVANFWSTIILIFAKNTFFQLPCSAMCNIYHVVGPYLAKGVTGCVDLFGFTNVNPLLQFNLAYSSKFNVHLTKTKIGHMFQAITTQGTIMSICRPHHLLHRQIVIFAPCLSQLEFCNEAGCRSGRRSALASTARHGGL